MTEVWEKVESILQKTELPERHTYFQLKNFIVGKEYTVQGQLWQVLREIKARKESVESLELQIEDAEDGLGLIDIKIERIVLAQTLAVDSLDQKELVISLRKTERERRGLVASIEKVKRKIRYLMEEITYFLGAYETLSKVEEVKPIDDIKAQKEYWNEKLLEELNLRLLLKNHLDPNLIQTILSLDNDAPVKISVMKILERGQEYLLAERDQRRSIAGVNAKQQRIVSNG